MRHFPTTVSLCSLVAFHLTAAPSPAAVNLTTTVVDFSEAVPAGVCPAFVTHAGDASRRLFVLDKRGYGETTFILQFPAWWSFAAALAGAVVFTLVCAYTVWRSLREARQGDEGR